MRAKKRFGQNFLTDDRVVAGIVAALEIEPGEQVVEIGPGEGVLTEQILDASAELTAIEIDRDLIPVLQRRFGANPNFRLIEGDFLSLNLTNIFQAYRQPLKLVGNLPYYISTPILERLIDSPIRFERLVVMLQREVVERITAAPGTSDRGYFTVLIENAFETENLMVVPPSAFRPAPAVHSAVVRLRPRARLIEDNAAFRSLVSAAFAQKRKTLLNNLRSVTPAAAEFIGDAAIDPVRRAETLTLEEWKRLSDSFNHLTPNR